MLNLQHIRERLGPNFSPFAIRLSDERSFDAHPDFIAVGRGVVLVLDQQDNSYKIDALHIVSLDSPSANGQNNR